VQEIGQPVDDRDRRVLGQLQHEIVAERAGHHAIDPAGEIERHVARRLACPDADLIRAQQHRVSAELSHARLEGHVGAQGRLLEVHRQRAPHQRLRPLPGPVAAAQLLGPLEQPLQIVGRPVCQTQKILGHRPILFRSFGTRAPTQAAASPCS
jgi:hypothetical protein